MTKSDNTNHMLVDGSSHSAPTYICFRVPMKDSRLQHSFVNKIRFISRLKLKLFYKNGRICLLLRSYIEGTTKQFAAVNRKNQF